LLCSVEKVLIRAFSPAPIGIATLAYAKFRSQIPAASPSAKMAGLELDNGRAVLYWRFSVDLFCSTSFATHCVIAAATIRANSNSG
jgi:hypothetical protein